MHVLIVKISSMGDILHTLPSLTDAMQAFPNICFDWVVEEKFSLIPLWHPAVRKIIIVSIRRWRKNWFSFSSKKERFNFKKQLQQTKYDIIIDAQGLLKSSFLITRNAFGKKHGFDFMTVREFFASFFYDYRHKINRKQHAVERVRQLFSASLKYSIYIDYGDYNISGYFNYKLCKIPNLIFLHSTSNTKKYWPEHYWRTLIKFAINFGYLIKLPWGSESEYLRSKRLSQGFDNKVQILPSLTLFEIAEHLINAVVIISVDTGLSHLAASLNCPNITLYGSTNPYFTGNYGYNQKSIYAKDGNMHNLSAEYVWKIFQEMFNFK